MSVQEIEIAITQLKGEEFGQLLSWLEEYQSALADPAARTPNYAMREALAAIRRRQVGRPVSDGSQTLQLIREARDCAMYGYDTSE